MFGVIHSSIMSDFVCLISVIAPSIDLKSHQMYMLFELDLNKRAVRVL